MTLRLIHCLVMLFALQAGPARAQDAVALLQRILLAYKDAGSIRFSAKIVLYEKEHPELIRETIHCKYLLHGQEYRCEIGELLMVVNKRQYVSADKATRLMVVGNTADLQSDARSLLPALEKMQQAIRNGSITSLVHRTDQEVVLELSDKFLVTGFPFYRIVADPHSGFLKKVAVHITDFRAASGPTMVSETSYTQPQPFHGNMAAFAQDGLVRVSKNALVPAPGYQGYQIINQTKRASR